MINKNKVQRAVELQLVANKQIDIYGQCSNDVVDELIELVDCFNHEEQDAFTAALMGEADARATKTPITIDYEG